MAAGSNFSAAPSALGYLFQIRYALVLLLRSEKPDSAISIEKFDDVAFEERGEPTQLLQFKHHINHRGMLTDSSVDLWKTIRIWATGVRERSIDLSSTILSLVTTGTAPERSAAALLRVGLGRDEAAALARLTAAGAASANLIVKEAHAALMSLGADAQLALFRRVNVLDDAPDVATASEALAFILRFSTRPQFLTALSSRLEGWWFRRTIEHLKNPNAIPAISSREVQVEIADLAEQFRRDNLPLDFPVEVDKDESELAPDERIFVEQLRAVMVSNLRIKKAISDYWRAFQQRSKWVREDLLLDRDLEEYEDRLVREWEELFLIMKENLTPGADPVLEGRNLYNNVVIAGRHIPIRPAFPNPYVMRGSFHMLANSVKIGWHPDFQKRFVTALSKAFRVVSDEGVE